MKFSHLLGVVCVAVATLFSGAEASAQGVIVPIVCEVRPCRPPRPIPHPVPLPAALPVKSIRLDTKINGQVATTHVEQVFRNDTRFTLEGTYFFPVPSDASIVEFVIWEDGKGLVGEVLTREEARRIYDEIVRRQRDPGLLEYAGKDLLQASIFPIPPNSDKKIELKYTQILKADSGTAAYRYPLGTGRNLWRDRRPGFETSNATVPRQQFGTVSGSIEIVGTGRLRNIYSPSHDIDIKMKGESAAAVSFETRDNDADLQLFYSVSNDDLGLSLMTYREPGKDGYFLLMLSPRDDTSDREVVDKDIVFVLDTSGSMADEGKIEKAKAALLFGIRTLRDGDRFGLINFAGEEHLLESSLIRADASGKRRGEEFVSRLRATGGTNINDTLIASLRLFGRNDRPKMLVFMTDGLPTVGETNNERILANLAKVKNADVRIFPFGFGYDVNTALLDRLGSENGGVSDYVQPKEDLEIKVSNFFTRVSSPVLSDPELDLGPVRTEMVYPRRPGDIFKGMQMVLIGRYKNESDIRNAVIRLTGKTGAETRTFTYRNLEFPMRGTENDFLPRLWASRRVGWLVEEIRINGETKELKDEVIELGTRYGIVTPYTSYLATDGSFAATRRDASGRATIAPGAERRMSEVRGADAIQMSVQQNVQKSNISLAARENESAENQVLIRRSANNQFVGNRNFFFEDGAWVDSAYSPERKLEEVTIRFASDEYFRLVAKERELARFFALGERVVVVWQDRVYRVAN